MHTSKYSWAKKRNFNEKKFNLIELNDEDGGFVTVVFSLLATPPAPNHVVNLTELHLLWLEHVALFRNRYCVMPAVIATPRLLLFPAGLGKVQLCDLGGSQGMFKREQLFIHT